MYASATDQAAESEILRLARDRARGALGEAAPAAEKLPMQDVFDARREVLDLHMAPALERYLIELVLASRDPSRYDAGLAPHCLGRQPARFHRAGTLRTCARLVGRPRLRHAR